MDIDVSTFEREVVEASKTTPVVVDFWAPWCAPCRALGPILEKLEREYQGRFRLAKVNSDENQPLAQAFGVRSIPMVLGFRGGRAVAQFTGALPESQVRAFVERLLPSAAELKVDEAEKLVAAGRHEAAAKLLDEVPSHIDWDERVETLRAAIAFAGAGGNEAELRARLAANPRDHDTRLALARLHAGAARWREAMEELLEIVREDKGWKDGEARRQLLQVFNLAGDPELVSEFRRKLATALY